LLEKRRYLEAKIPVAKWQSFRWQLM